MPLASGVAAATAPAYGVMWAANGAENSLSEYAPRASGSVSPIATISGTHTGLHDPSAVAVSGSGRVFVTNAGNDSITVYAPTASGDASPIATIAGSKTGLDSPSSVALSDGEVWVTDPASDLVEAFSADRSGNILPAETISGHKTLLDHPVAIALGGEGFPTITVANDPSSGHASLLTFLSDRRGDIAPLTVAVGDKKHPLVSPTSLMTADDFGSVWVTDAGTNTVSEVLTLLAAPSIEVLHSIAGSHTGLDQPAGISHDALGHFVVANSGNNTIEYFGAKARGDARPLRTLSGVGTTGTAPVGAAVFGTPPAAPSGLKVALHKTTAKLQWKAPTVTGGGIVGYEVERERVDGLGGLGGLGGIILELGLGGPTTFTHKTSLTERNIKPGHRYVFMVVAVNGFGASPSSNRVHVAHVLVPSAPRKVAAYGAPHAVLVHWQEPAQDGGAAIKGFRVEYADGCVPGSAGCKTHSQTASRWSDATRISHLKSKSDYEVRVVARNKKGAGAPSRIAKVHTS